MDTTTILGIATVPAIMGLVEAAKTAGLPQRFAPLASIAIGILAGMLAHSAGSASWAQSLAGGVALGLAAAGLYSGGKTTLAARKQARLRAALLNRRRTPRTLPPARSAFHTRTDGRTGPQPQPAKDPAPDEANS